MKYVVGIVLAVVLVSGMALASTINIQSIGKIEGTSFSSPDGGHISIVPRDTVDSIPDIRAALGSPGRNIAVRGDTVVVISGPPSGDAANIFNGVVAYYSFDGGHTFEAHPLSTAQVRRIYPGVEWPESWAHDGPLFFWHEAPREGGVYQPSKVFVAWDLAWPSGVFNVVELPNSQDWDAWLPSADASGDTIIVCAANVLTTFLSFIWRSYDGGTTWDADTFITQGAVGGWHDTPIPRIGHNGYVAVITDWDVPEYGWDAYTPFFLESMDGGQTWIDTINLWDASGWTPYDSAGSWWYVYNFILDNNDKPHIAWKFGAGSFEFGDCWHFYPASGSPGNWSDWNMQLMVGNGDGSTVATQPWIGYDPVNDMLVYTYLAYFINGSDTLPDIGIYASTDGGATWTDAGIWGSDSMYEEANEIPSILPSSGTHTRLHSIFIDNDNPTQLFHAGPYGVSVYEATPTQVSGLTINLPTLTSRTLPISFALSRRGKVDISLFDVSGRKVLNLYNGVLNAGSHSINAPVERLSSGTYFIHVITEEGETVEKVEIIK